MSAGLILLLVGSYFAILYLIALITSKGANNDSFYVGNKQSPWFVVAFGMIGASLSGITFISVPGWVGNGPVKAIEGGKEILYYSGTNFGYMQMVLGYLVGYAFIALVLMPIYYRMNLSSIYTFLRVRFGKYSHKVGAIFFLISRIIGASLRLYLVVVVLQMAVFNPLGVPVYLTVLFTILLIWIYTYKGGIKTIVYTDTLQTTFMLLALGVGLYVIASKFQVGLPEFLGQIMESELSKTFFFENGWQNGNNFYKRFLGGAAIAIVMTGLDQDMMQKNLSCKNIGDAQKNMFWFSIILVFVNLLFMCLGAALFMYADKFGISLPNRSDYIFHTIAFDKSMPIMFGVIFLIGLLAAAFSSADSALTSLTTSFCLDILEKEDRKTRYLVHIGFSVILMAVILAFYQWNNEAAIWTLFTAAGYTYGPLLGLFIFGIFTKWKPIDALSILICIAAPILCYIINMNSESWLGGYKFGFEILILNGAITFLGLFLASAINNFETITKDPSKT